MADEFGGARRPGRPPALLVGGDQQRLSPQSSDIGGRFGIPEGFDQRAGAHEFRVVVDQDQVRVHHTVSASMPSYSRWAPKNRMARTPARYCSAATSRK